MAGRTDAAYRTALVDLLWDRKSESVRLLCIAEIANLRQIAATDLIKKLERPEQITYAVVLCLGRLGTNASRAVALVRALVSDPKTDQPLRITGQISLANMGIAPLENERSVLEVITQRNTGAKRAVYDLAMVRPTWPLSSGMVTELAIRLSTDPVSRLVSGLRIILPIAS